MALDYSNLNVLTVSKLSQLEDGVGCKLILGKNTVGRAALLGISDLLAHVPSSIAIQVLSKSSTADLSADRRLVTTKAIQTVLEYDRVEGSQGDKGIQGPTGKNMDSTLGFEVLNGLLPSNYFQLQWVTKMKANTIEAQNFFDI